MLRVRKHFFGKMFARFSVLLAVILIFPSANCDDMLYGAEDIYEDSSVLTTPCILKLSEKYFASIIKTQGSLVIVNILPDASFFQRNILNALNENDRHDLAIMVKDARQKHVSSSQHEIW